MRSAILVLAVLGLVPATLCAQGSWADKMFEEGTSHDFGSIPRGAQLFHRFKVKNLYAVKLDVINVRTSCGCVSVTPPPGGLESREEAVVEVMMDARKFTGRKTVMVYLTFGPQFISTATLQVSANSRADVVFNPGQINFGVVPVGHRPTQTVEVEYAGVLSWQIKEIVQNNAPVEARFEESYRRPGQVGFKVSVTLKEDAPAGMFKQELYLRTNDPTSPLVPLLVEATVQRPLTVAPNVIKLERPKAGGTLTRRVVVRGNRPFRITGIDGLGDEVRAELPTSATSSHVLTLILRPSKEGDWKHALQIRTDLVPDSPLTVTIVGNVTAP